MRNAADASKAKEKTWLILFGEARKNGLRTAEMGAVTKTYIFATVSTTGMPRRRVSIEALT
jgi:hypothetical protein